MHVCPVQIYPDGHDGMVNDDPELEATQETPFQVYPAMHWYRGVLMLELIMHTP